MFAWPGDWARLSGKGRRHMKRPPTLYTGIQNKRVSSLLLLQGHFKAELGEFKALSFISFPQSLVGSGFSTSECILELISISWQCECCCWFAQTNLISLKCKLDGMPLLKTLLGFLGIKSKFFTFPCKAWQYPAPDFSSHPTVQFIFSLGVSIHLPGLPGREWH